MTTLANQPAPVASDAIAPRLISRRFAAIMGATFAYFAGFGVLLPTLPRFVEGPLGGGGVQVGLSIGAFYLAALLTRPLAGRLGDRRGRRVLMILGAGLAAVAVVAQTQVGDLAVLVGLRLAAGLGEAAFFVGAVAAVSDLAPPNRRGEAMSLFSLALYAGIAIGPAAGEHMLERAGFGLTWILSGALALLAATVALGVPGRPAQARRPGPATRSGRGRARLMHPAGLKPGVLMAVATVALAGFNGFVSLHATGVGLQGSRAAFVLFAAIVLGIRSIGARLPDRLGAHRAAPAALGLVAAGMAAIALWRSPAGLLVGTAVFAAGNGLAFPSLSALALHRAAPEERGAVLGTFTAFIDFGFGAGALGLGIVASAAGYPAVFAAAALASAAGLALLAAGGLGSRSDAVAPAA